MKLKYKVPLTNIIILSLGFIVLTFISTNLIYDYLLASRTSEAINHINIHTYHIKNKIELAKTQLNTMDDTSFVQSMDWNQIKPYFEDRLNDGIFDKLGIVYPDRTYHITSSDTLGDLSDREYLHNAFKGYQVISEPLYSRSDNSYQIVIANPVNNNGTIVGVLIGVIHMYNIQETIHTLNLDGLGFGFLTDKSGNILIHPIEEYINSINLYDYVDAPIIDESGYVTYEWVDGSDNYIFYNKLDPPGWYAHISIASKDFNRPIYKFIVRFISILTAVLFAIIIATTILIRRFTGSIDSLINGMEIAEQGDYTIQIPIVHNDEIGQIASQYNKTIEAILMRDEELQSSNEELTASFEEIHDTHDKLTRAYQNINHNLKQQQIINAMAEKLFTIKSLDELFDEALQYTHKMLDSKQSIIFMYDKDEDLFKPKVAVNFDEDALKGYVFKPSEGTFRWIVSTKRELIIENIHEDNLFQPKIPDDKKYNMLFHVPILDEKDNVIGTICFYSNHLDLDYAPTLKQISKLMSTSIQNKELIEDIKETYFEIIVSLVKAMELKDSYTRGHSERVMEYSLMLGKRLNLSHEEMDILKHGSILHDIGKLGIPDSILLKQGRLTGEEYQIVKSHPEKGELFIKSLKFLHNTLAIIRNHHERFDGNGYPDGLKGYDIPILTRIVTIADAVDAMTSERTYRKQMSYPEAIEELKRNRSTQFDPVLVDAFVEIINEMHKNTNNT